VLVLVPSRLEAAALAPVLGDREGPVDWPGRSGRVVVARCGVGLPAAGARAGVLATRTGAELVVLAGIAGTHAPDQLELGSLLVPDRVELDGVGVGEGAAHRPMEAAGGALAAEADFASGPIPLTAESIPGAVSGALLSVAAASADEDEARRRRERHPRCVAEDMEAWAVARAAREAGATALVLRGISNRAGVRDRAAWRVDEALAVVRRCLGQLVEAAAP
jgi:futalosine hydrolase